MPQCPHTVDGNRCLDSAGHLGEHLPANKPLSLDEAVRVGFVRLPTPQSLVGQSRSTRKRRAHSLAVGLFALTSLGPVEAFAEARRVLGLSPPRQGAESRYEPLPDDESSVF